MINLLWILLALALVLLNAFFVAAEFGMVKLRHTRLEIIEEKYGMRGRILSRIHRNLDAYLSACQLGITLASLGLGWVGEPAFSQLLLPIFALISVGLPHTFEFVSFFVAFSIISFLHIVIGELMPKSLAIRQSEQISIWTAVPLYIFYWMMFPAIWLLNSCSNFLLKIINLHKSHKNDHFYSSDEIKLILNSSHLHGELTKDETEILEHTLDFADLEVTDIMRPISEMVTVSIDQPIKNALDTVAKARYSRYPVVDVKQNIIGVVHVKDLFVAQYQQQQIISLQELLRPILKVSEECPALELLNKFRRGYPHFAIIYRADMPIGFITLDNLLHILVGRIKDEFHRTRDDWTSLPDGGFLINGKSSIYTVERALDIEIAQEEEVSTFYGLILNKLGRLPHQGEKIEFDDFTAIIEAMDGPRISQVRVYKKS